MEQLEPMEVIYINDDQDFSQNLDTIFQGQAISLYLTENFSKLYITTNTRKTFILRFHKISSTCIGTLIAKENLIKYAINSFDFIKWCNSQSIEIKGLLDIPTYIKLLTNDVDPFKTAESYFLQYTDFFIDENDKEINHLRISNFIYTFGNLLSKYIEKFDLTTVSKLINENSYYEGKLFNNTGNCSLLLSYINVEKAISTISKSILDKYQSSAYIISPLNRIAPKFKQDEMNLIHEVYAEDLSITILNELYNNNIPVKLDYKTNQYKITCKQKNFSSIITLVQAIFSEAFFALFDQAPEIYIECIIKEDIS